MNPRPCLCRAFLPLLLLLEISFGNLALRAVGASSGAEENRLPKIDPDYCGVVIPPNIAPLNFRLEEPGIFFAVVLQGQAGKPIQVTSRKPEIALPIRPWRALLEANRGKEFSIRVTVKNKNGVLARFAAITNFVAREEIDGYLVYRRLNWQFSMYGSGNIGIYQRNLSDFQESEIVRVKERSEQAATCVNCHTFLEHRPEVMVLHARVGLTGEKPMMIANEGKVTTVAKPFGLLAWHPSGRLLAFSQNRFSMVLHTIGRNRDVYDGTGDLGIYVVETGTVVMPPKISRPDRFETWPAWSPDGKYLYFCSGPNLPLERYQEIKYDLMRIAFDEPTGAWGDVEEVLSSKTTGLSIAQPKISPDGNYLLFCMFPYSSFPGTQPQSDLYLMDLRTKMHRRLDPVNSERSESYHSWSSNGRWFVFSSKRRDGLLTRPYFAYFDEQGEAHKPFLLPQQDPVDFYDSLPQMFNLPELVKGRVPYGQRTWFNAMYTPDHRILPREEGPVRTNTVPVPTSEEYMK
jgi:WD40-like Beta Propeller Repeat